MVTLYLLLTVVDTRNVEACILYLYKLTWIEHTHRYLHRYCHSQFQDKLDACDTLMTIT
jgi:hypothetical protein